MALKLRLALLARRILSRLAYPPCPGTKLCRPFVQHSSHSIRDVCLLCGRKGPWKRVVGPF